jgi:stage V sporulation protein AE
MIYFNAFWVGGLICLIGQILIDKTKLTPARILVSFVVAGVILTLIGVYEPIVKFAGSGATVPIAGFGYNLCKGVIKGVTENGFYGIFKNTIGSASAGITAVVLFGFLSAIIFKPKMKK